MQKYSIFFRNAESESRNAESESRNAESRNAESESRNAESESESHYSYLLFQPNNFDVKLSQDESQAIISHVL